MTVSYPRIERRKVSVEGRFCIGETKCTKFHTTEVYSLKLQGESLARGPKLLSIKNYVIEIMT